VQAAEGSAGQLLTDRERHSLVEGDAIHRIEVQASADFCSLRVLLSPF
jgi:hypothetical protein